MCQLSCVVIIVIIIIFVIIQLIFLSWRAIGSHIRPCDRAPDLQPLPPTTTTDIAAAHIAATTNTDTAAAAVNATIEGKFSHINGTNSKRRREEKREKKSSPDDGELSRR